MQWNLTVDQKLHEPTGLVIGEKVFRHFMKRCYDGDIA